jgi:hypothetical protein
VGLGSSHGRGDAGPALQPRRTARASPALMAERSGAQRPVRLAGETLAEARSMERSAAPTSKRSRSSAAHQLWCDRWPRLCHWLRGPVTICSGEVGRPDQAIGQPFQPRHAPHSRRSLQPSGRSHRPLGRSAAADPAGAASVVAALSRRPRPFAERTSKRMPQRMLSTTTAQRLP